MQSALDLSQVFSCPTNDEFISIITSTYFKQHVEGLLFCVKLDWESYFREATKRGLLSIFVTKILEVLEQHVIKTPQETVYFNFKSIMDLLSVNYITEIDFLLFK